jgi:protein tyrosine phosphatase
VGGVWGCGVCGGVGVVGVWGHSLRSTFPRLHLLRLWTPTILIIIFKHLAVDHTRVILLDVEPGNSDYINANRILPDDDHLPNLNKKEYIATQGCLLNTRADFWQMVWQEKTRFIVMTTKEVEKRKPKCDKYWPDLDGTESFGAFVIKTLSEKASHDYTLREFSVRKNGTSNDAGERKIYHYHFQVRIFR